MAPSEFARGSRSSPAQQLKRSRKFLLPSGTKTGSASTLDFANKKLVALKGAGHDHRMVWLMRIVAALLADAFRLVLLLLRSSSAIRAENLVLRKQLAPIHRARRQAAAR
jgi:hypothetical protein